ncbi:MAG: hypothetical protein EB078_04455 [Proteobacteria bacterium]|nr:hypothetical protein [Pseudomonadota bacterium]NDC24397.1 hypothetical protein [Pseudomonadota bacterium]NDD04135.1 hypothetical protein [Pseudomonadota bacterium]NDG25610.1 hypothetical protein [Pseudomonadota bacterium]
MTGLSSTIYRFLNLRIIASGVVLLGLSLSTSVRAENGEVLFGAAAITASVSAMVAPGIMSQAQTQVKQIQAQTATQITGMNAQAALYQAKIQSDLALSQAFLARDQAFYVQQSQTRDLVSQLQFLAYNRALDNQLERESMARDMAVQQAYLGLESKRMYLNQILAETSMLTGGSPALLPAQATANINASTPPATTANLSALSANSTSTPSYGLRGIVGSGLSSGSTRGRRFVSDLSSFSASIFPNASYQEPEGIPHAQRGRGIRSLASEPSHHRR